MTCVSMRCLKYMSTFSGSNQFFDEGFKLHVSSNINHSLNLLQEISVALETKALEDV